MRNINKQVPKLIIVDGLLAFKGSANLTLHSWEAENEMREVESDLNEIRKLNSNNFAPQFNECRDRYKPPRINKSMDLKIRRKISRK